MPLERTPVHGEVPNMPVERRTSLPLERTPVHGEVIGLNLIFRVCALNYLNPRRLAACNKISLVAGANGLEIKLQKKANVFAKEEKPESLYVFCLGADHVRQNSEPLSGTLA